MKSKLLSPIVVVLFGMGTLMLTQLVPGQWDMTADRRYTLAEETVATLQQIDQPIFMDVLLGGELPPSYLRLRSELTVLLQQMQQINTKIQFNFVDPFEDNQDQESLLKDLYNYGLTPEVDIDETGQSTEQIIVVPWVILNSENKSISVSLLQKNLGDLPEERLEQSIQQLEYHLMDGLHQLFLKEKKRIAVIKSHQTSNDINITSLLQSVLPYYNIASFDLKAFPDQPEKTLENLLRFDLLFMSNPKGVFSQNEKFMLDQFTQAGGSSLYLVDPVTVAQDSLFSLQGDAFAYPNALELDELFFKYGVRLNQDIVSDLYSAPIVLAQGQNANSEYRPYPWVYHPLSTPQRDHPVGSAISNVLQRFVSSIDTLPSPLKKTILLTTSEQTKRKTPPFIVALKEATLPIKPSAYSDPVALTGVLLEGEFPSLFQYRVAPFAWEKSSTTQPAKIAVFADGNLAENQTDKGEPLALGYDKWTNNLYGNKLFLQNTIHYLMGEESRLQLRSKTVQMAFLDGVLLNENNRTLQFIALWSPLLFLLFLGGGLRLFKQFNRQ